jgi:hypothetical protein
VEITVKVRDQSTSAARGEPGAADSGGLEESLRESGVTLEPMHPGSDDPALASWFRAEVEDDRVDDVLRTLRSSAAIEAAYVKPAAEPP